MTNLDPITKKALREVRQAIMAGRVSDPVLGDADWMIGLDSRGGSGMRFRFSFKKVS